MDSLKKAVSSFKDRIVKSPLERSVIEVCSDENWGSANTALHEISEKTFNHEDRQAIMKLIWELLRSPSKEWRRLYKVLNLIDHLIKFGSTACVHEIQDEAFKIRMLQDFSFREGSEEKGIGVRDKAKYISSMLSDRRVLDEEREKAKKTWSKFSGISSGDNYSRGDWRAGYDSYNDRRAEDSYQDRREDRREDRRNDDRRNDDRRNDDRRNDDRRFEDRGHGDRKAETSEVKDIFKEPEIKVVKLQPKETVWDREPGKLPTAPKLKPPTSSGTSNIFEPVTVKKVNEVKPASNPYDPNSPFTQESVFAPVPVTPSFPSTSVSTGPFPSTVYSHPVANPVPSFPQSTFPSNPVHQNPSTTLSHVPPSYPSSSPNIPVTAPQGLPQNPSKPMTSGTPGYAPQFSSGVYNPQISPGGISTSLGTHNYSGPSYTGNISSPGPSGLVYTGQIGVNPMGYPNQPAPSYNQIGNPALNVNPSFGNNGLIGLNLGKPDYPATTTTGQMQGSKIHSNLTGGSGFSMEDMKKLGGSGFSTFQSAPIEPVKVDIESKLMNLDNLEAGQPKIKEIVKSRW